VNDSIPKTGGEQTNYWGFIGQMAYQKSKQSQTDEDTSRAANTKDEERGPEKNTPWGWLRLRVTGAVTFKGELTARRIRGRRKKQYANGGRQGKGGQKEPYY